MRNQIRQLLEARRLRKRRKTLTDPSGDLKFNASNLSDLTNDDIIRLGFWMRRPSPWATSSGALYGAIVFGFSPIYILTESVSAIREMNIIFWLTLFVLFITTGTMLGMLIGISIMNWNRRQDDFLIYGVYCKRLIMLHAEFFEPGSLRAREILAQQIELFRRSSDQLKIANNKRLNRLDTIATKKKITGNDLNEVADIGRAAVLAAFRGKVDMPAVAPHLLRNFDKPFGSTLAVTLRHTFTFLIALTGLVPLLDLIRGL